MFKSGRTLVLFLALACAGPVFADADPTLSQVYGAARSGHLAEAQQMMSQVLRDHPKSGKAHYVAAEIYAREGNFPVARQELSTAQALEPGLPFAKPESVRELQQELSQSRPTRAAPGYGVAPYTATRSSFPWGFVLVVVGLAALVWLIVRRRTAPASYAYPGGVPSAAGVPGGYGPYSGPGPYGPAGSGIGSTVAGGLASGLAVGAGVVAGEELARHFLDGDRREGGVLPAEPERFAEPDNSNMGGADFGVSDPGSWDDGGGSFGGDVGGGGDDWT
ncbi:MAG TPA: tetratricopeptide repeat protein [Steroidobacteraceae bacterium]|nr:tetratricopeptide repeat protein [Steroidobacteraceae bacterium]